MPNDRVDLIFQSKYTLAHWYWCIPMFLFSPTQLLWPQCWWIGAGKGQTRMLCRWRHWLLWHRWLEGCNVAQCITKNAGSTHSLEHKLLAFCQVTPEETWRHSRVPGHTGWKRLPYSSTLVSGFPSAAGTSLRVLLRHSEEVLYFNQWPQGFHLINRGGNGKICLPLPLNANKWEALYSFIKIKGFH